MKLPEEIASISIEIHLDEELTANIGNHNNLKCLESFKPKMFKQS